MARTWVVAAGTVSARPTASSTSDGDRPQITWTRTWETITASPVPVIATSRSRGHHRFTTPRFRLPGRPAQAAQISSHATAAPAVCAVDCCRVTVVFGPTRNVGLLMPWYPVPAPPALMDALGLPEASG